MFYCRVQASDGNFFEKVTAPSDGDTARDDELYTIKNLSIVGDKKQIEVSSLNKKLQKLIACEKNESSKIEFP